ncbi:MAG TPA: hypothetical protein VMT70_13300 [Vicinamibacteria bacterium]|nr:hypothetical protein [Vicinamibacteria bacterium]
MRTSLTLGAALALPLAAAAQDPVKVDPAHYRVLLDNAAVRVLKIHMPVGARSVMHVHPDAILVPLSSGKARFTMPDGKSEEHDLTQDAATYTPATTHDPANVGTTAIDAILVELKAKSPGTATLPSARPGMQAATLAEGPRAVAIKVTAGPDFREATGSTHEFDQVVIALGAASLALSVEGKPPVSGWKRGDVQFIGRGVRHESSNAGGQPADFVIVAVR